MGPEAETRRENRQRRPGHRRGQHGFDGCFLKFSTDAATQYLKRTTNAQLTTAFAPIMQQSLDKVGATRYYAQLATTYNHMPLGKSVQAD
ncbi:hypothetical protein GCM10011495_25240 [Hymenobacter frigidus]|uniref:Uncharacterized protein n=1 Tax=Hymenobacter frigidus TaxID=1524095 RepID=A0ABQ2A985_9BACT|nr:hypothetical protein GCM10011495_25240 [Hymenobacter frigidus]